MLRAAPGLVLIVDDHEMIRDLLEQILQDQGHRTITAGSGPEALALLREHSIDVVILDMMLPGMSGLKVLHRIKRNPGTAHIPVLVVSADSDVEKIANCINLGAEDYLIKPFNAILVKARVNTCLEKHRLRAQERNYQLTLEQRAAALEQAQAELRVSEASLKRQTSILQSILNSMGDGVVVVDTHGMLVHNNPAAEQILGEHMAELLPIAKHVNLAFQHSTELTPCETQDLPLSQAIRGCEIDGMELFVAQPQDHAGQWLSITARPLRELQGSITGAVAVVRDISATKRVELALRDSEERYALAARGANDGLWDWDLRRNQIHYSPRWKAMLGYLDHEIGTDPCEWMDRVHPDDREQLESRLSAHHRKLITHFEHEHRIMHSDGTYRWVLCRGLAVWDATNRPMRMAGSQTDITDRKQFEQRLVHDAFHDSLTGLPNRALFVDRLSQALVRIRCNPSYRFTVLFLDLDRFKIINDSLGHAVGDQLLIAIASRLQACLRPSDTVARLGGDEFTILIESMDDDLAPDDIVEPIQHAIAKPLYLDGQSVFTTASIGVLPGRTEYHSAAEMIRDADTAMYQAKMAGKARAVVFDPSMHVQAMLHLHTEAELRWAIERDELRVYYQPIVALDTGRVEGVEALLRWQHPQRGLLYPPDFLNVAEDSGLIIPISWWVLREACRQLYWWQQHLPGAESLWVSVNICPQQLTYPDFVRTVCQILDDTGLSPEYLKLEITEHALVEHSDTSSRILARLREKGVRLCIDDFGTGYSSLSYLNLLPVDVLKIDRSFIKRIGEQDDRGGIVQTIIGLARTLGLKAVAEGTETLQQVAELRRLSCDFGQGWLFSKALDAPNLEELMLSEQVFV